MIDHVSIRVSDFEKSRKFYGAILGVLDYKVIREDEGKIGYLGPGNASVWIRKDNFVSSGVHVAFRAPNQETVDRFHEIGLAAGGSDNGKPGTRSHRGEQYIAFVLDPDGNNIEVVHQPDVN